MPDKEKVIKALACCVFPVSKGFPCQSHIADKGCEVDECPYQGDCDQMLLDALKLLKEQEPLKPFQYNGTYWCEKCGNIVSQREININNHKFLMNRYKYCPECGRKVKWYD